MKKGKNNKRVIILISSIILVVIAYSYVFKSHRDIETEKPEFNLQAEALANQFKDNAVQSETKYLNKTLEISGNITEIKETYLVLNQHIFCQFSTPIPKIHDSITVINIKGRCIGYDDLLEEIKLDQCTIIHK